MKAHLNENRLAGLMQPNNVALNPVVGTVEPLAVGTRIACELLSVSENTLKQLVAMGLPVVKLDGKNLFPVGPMREWLAEQAKKGKP